MELPFEKIKRVMLTRKEAQPGPYGKDPNERSIQELLERGVINIDKPKGPTSHQISAYVQKILEIKKSGHSGTLDPKVTGVLPVAIEKATRVVQTLLPAGKEYICLMHIHDPKTPEEIHKVVSKFVGKIKQLPPIKSAVKRQQRYRKIYYINVLEINEQDVLFYVGCQAGTYIRKLCHDMGEALGCGAHMAELRRTKAGPFKDKEAHTLQEVKDAFWYYKENNDDSKLKEILLPIEQAVRHLPKVVLLDATISSVTHGCDVKVPGIARVESEIQVDELVALMTLKGELVAIGNARMISKEMVEKESGIAVKVDKVFMPDGIYPRLIAKKDKTEEETKKSDQEGKQDQNE